MEKLYCPFCSKEIKAQDILFVDEDTLGTMENENQYDPKRFEFESKVLVFGSIKTPDGKLITMEKRPKYKFHRWHKHQNESLPFFPPNSISMPMRGGSGIPEDITVYRSKGMTPRQLSGEEPASWERKTVEKKAAPEKNDEPKKEASTGDMLKSMLLGGMAAQQNAAKTASVETQLMPDEAVMTLTDKACPECHCILPEQFGSVPTYRVAMLGGTASGKTTYMVAAANLLEKQAGLPANVVNNCRISEESKRYFDFLIQCLEYNRLAATLIDKTTVIRFVFPIVLNVTTVTQDGENEHEFILIINDIPGEAMKEKSFLMSYPGLLRANGIVMLMDPFQFINGPVKKQLVLKDWEMLNANREETNKSDEEKLRDHQRSFTPDPFSATVNDVKRMLQDSKFTELSAMTMVLNKLDLLYGGNKPYIDVNKDTAFRCINGQFDMNAQHMEGMDMVYIEELSRQVEFVISGKLGYSTYSNVIKPMAEAIGHPIRTLCISIRSWNAGRGEFECDADSNGFIDRGDILGFRMLEPLLYTMEELGLIRTKDHVENEQGEGEPEIKRGLFSRLFRRR